MARDAVLMMGVSLSECGAERRFGFTAETPPHPKRRFAPHSKRLSHGLWTDPRVHAYIPSTAYERRW